MEHPAKNHLPNTQTMAHHMMSCLKFQSKSNVKILKDSTQKLQAASKGLRIKMTGLLNNHKELDSNGIMP